jgi:hypothetical protein
MATWTAIYEGNEIRIESSWLWHEKLIVNNKLQDENYHTWYASSSGLTGHLVSKDGERKPIKVRCRMGCLLFIDDENIEVVKTS